MVVLCFLSYLLHYKKSSDSEPDEIIMIGSQKMACHVMLPKAFAVLANRKEAEIAQTFSLIV